MEKNKHSNSFQKESGERKPHSDSFQKKVKNKRPPPPLELPPKENGKKPFELPPTASGKRPPSAGRPNSFGGWQPGPEDAAMYCYQPLFRRRKVKKRPPPHPHRDCWPPGPSCRTQGNLPRGYLSCFVCGCGCVSGRVCVSLCLAVCNPRSPPLPRLPGLFGFMYVSSACGHVCLCLLFLWSNIFLVRQTVLAPFARVVSVCLSLPDEFLACIYLRFVHVCVLSGLCLS